MSNIAWTPAERLRAYQAMAEAGVTGLEIAPGLFFHAADDPFEPDAQVARAACDEIAAFGLDLVSMQSLLFGVPAAGLFDGEDALAHFQLGVGRAIALAGRFGIPNLVFGSPAQRRIPPTMTPQAATEQAAEVFHRLGDAAQKAGTTLTIEANPAAYGTNFLNTLDEAADFVARVDHPCVALILDLGAMYMNGDDDTLARQIPAMISRLHHVHVSEPHLGSAPRDPAALAPVLTALQSVGYTKAISIEMKRSDAGIADVQAALARLLAAKRDMDQRDE